MSGLKKEGQCFVNSGGRVILAIGEGPTVEKAQANAYEHARQIKVIIFYRNDIGNKAITK